MEFSGNAIKKLGKRLRDGSREPVDIKMLEDYRATFDPLLVEMSLGLDKILRDTGEPFLLSGRTKRTKSIVRKLQRSENWGMDLSRVSDLVGLRIVVKDTASQNRVLGAINACLETKDIDDYRENPAGSGYRCVHVIVRDGKQLLEIQLRTMPQHLWAVESEAFGEQVKEGGGTEEIRLYLTTLSDLCSRLDEGEPVSEGETDVPFLIQRMPISGTLERLQERFKAATKHKHQEGEETSYLIVFNRDLGEQLHELRFGPDEREEAVSQYQLINRTMDDTRFDVLILNTTVKAGLPVTHPQFF